MRTQKINRDDAEKVEVIVQNGYTTATITDGQAVCWDYTNEVDGVTVSIPTTALLPLAAGLVSSPNGIASTEFGFVQCYGHHPRGSVEGGTDVSVGDPLIAQNADFDLVKATALSTAAGTWALNGDLDAFSNLFVAGEAYTTAAAAAKKVFIRCM
jgi:hypothetical protein